MTKKEIAVENKRGFIHFIIHNGKSLRNPLERGHVLSTRLSGIRVICIELSKTEVDFYSMSDAEIISNYKIFLATVFAFRYLEPGIINAKYSFRWYMHFCGIDYDPINGLEEAVFTRNTVPQYKKINQDIQKPVDVEKAVVSFENQLIPLEDVKVFKGNDGALYLKILG
tara:strand:+ start:14526 stop:15032 length:507 start_codon:yes stop_codon:yes gene_type:complete